jgi:hypothetical protein
LNVVLGLGKLEFDAQVGPENGWHDPDITKRGKLKMFCGPAVKTS